MISRLRERLREYEKSSPHRPKNSLINASTETIPNEQKLESLWRENRLIVEGAMISDVECYEEKLNVNDRSSADLSMAHCSAAD
ncbi:hypothetical protein L1887_30325 [Cichorium endivia]|nr:hypothetical protein L1887_30325 [Cichorium endivia]